MVNVVELEEDSGVPVNSPELVILRSERYENDVFVEDLRNGFFFQCSFLRVDFRELRLDSVKFKECEFDICFFRGINFGAVVFEDCTFTLCALQDSSFVQSDLVATRFKKCELELLRFDRCSVREIEFISSIIQQIDFDQCQSQGVVGTNNLIRSSGDLQVEEVLDFNEYYKPSKVTAETRETYTRLRVVRQYEKVASWAQTAAFWLSIIFLITLLSGSSVSVYMQIQQFGLVDALMALADFSVLPWLIGSVTLVALARYVQTKLMIQKASLLRILDGYQDEK